jgi:epoxyqueuosine reductase
MVLLHHQCCVENGIFYRFAPLPSVNNLVTITGFCMSRFDMYRDLKTEIISRCRMMEIPLAGIAAVDRWKNPLFQPWIPKEFFPDSIFPETSSVLVIGLPVHLPVLETSPSIWYRELYATVNTLLDQYNYRLAEFLNRKGYPSVFVPLDDGNIDVLLENPVAFFSHSHAAFLAGLGNFGINNMLLTPEYGPKVRFGSVLTAADLPSDPMIDDLLRTRCLQRVKSCPSSALSTEDYPKGITDIRACTRPSASLNRRYAAPCGVCIKVCPVGEDRKWYRREDTEVYADRKRSPKSSPVMEPCPELRNKA